MSDPVYCLVMLAASIGAILVAIVICNKFLEGPRR